MLHVQKYHSRTKIKNRKSNFLTFGQNKSKMLKTILYVAIGGALGSILRYLTTVFVQKHWSGNFPLATFIANVLGCFLIGLFMGILQKHQLADSQLKWLLITGFCGGYTTFSAFGYENFSLFQNQHSVVALLYIALSIIAGLLALGAGLYLSR